MSMKRISDEDKRVLFTNANYGYRTPLDHARYYQYKRDNECAQIIESEIQRLGIIDPHRHSNIRFYSLHIG